MANYFVSQSGSNTAPYDTWAKAATSLQTALTAATASGDIVALDAGNPPTADKELAADTTYTFAGTGVALIASTNSGTSTVTPTTMGTSQWIGNSTTNRSVVFAPGAAARSVSVYGLTVRTAGGTSDSISCNGTSGSTIVWVESYFWQGNTVSTAGIYTAGTTSSQNYSRFENCTFRLGATGQSIFISSGESEFLGCTLATAGSAPTDLFDNVAIAGGAVVWCEGCDWSHAGSGNLAADMSACNVTITMARCKLGSGYVGLATQTEGLAGASLALYDCASGDTQGLFGYYDGLGSCVSDTGITTSIGSPSPGQSWKIVTTSQASFLNPFRTPWIDRYNTTLSAITPRIEILRDGSTTAYTDAQVWGEFSALTTAGSTASTIYSDRQALVDFVAGTGGTNQAAGAGLSSWSGEGGSAWSGKVETASSITPAETGEVSGRVCVGAASATVYIEPAVRW